MTLREDLKTRSWASLSDAERSAWLHLFVLDNDVQYIESSLVLNDGTILKDKPNPELIFRCEREIMHTYIEDFYVTACTTEISNLTYKNIQKDKVKDSDTAKLYYRNAIFLSPDIKAKCLFFAKRKVKV